MTSRPLLSKVSPIHNGLEADAFDALFGAGTALGGLVARTDFIVIDIVILSVVAWRKVRHHHISAILNAQLTTLRM